MIKIFPHSITSCGYVFLGWALIFMAIQQTEGWSLEPMEEEEQKPKYSASDSITGKADANTEQEAIRAPLKRPKTNEFGNF